MLEGNSPVTTELSFLVELLINHRLQKPTKDLVIARIKDVEIGLQSRPPMIQMPQPIRPVQNPIAQAPSTLALLAKHGDLPPAEPVAVIAQTTATAAAMASREQAIAESMSGKVDKQTGRPRKF